jgi:hypothetical protein
MNPQEKLTEDAVANTKHLYARLQDVDPAQDSSMGFLMRRISLLENDIKDLQAKHGALVALVYSRGGK